MDKIVRLNTKANSILSIANYLVSLAEQNELSNLCICAVTKDGNIASVIFAETDIFALLGAVTDMQRTITDKIERR